MGRQRANVLAFYAMQAGNYLLPLLSLPLLIRTLGAEAFGVLALAFSLVTFAVLATDAGFHSVTLRLLTRNRKRPRRLSGLVCANLLIRTGVGTVALLVALGAASVFPGLENHFPAVLIAGLTVAGTVAFPFTFLVAMEQGEIIATCTVLGRLLAVGLMFLLLRTPEDLYTAVFLQTCALLFSAALFYTLFGRSTFPRLRLPKRRELQAILLGVKRLWPAAVLREAGYNMTIPMLAAFQDTATVGIYALFEKVVRATSSAFVPLIYALAPYWIHVRAVSQGRDLRARAAISGVAAALFLAVLVLLGSYRFWQPFLIPSAPASFDLLFVLSLAMVLHVLCELILNWRVMPEGKLSMAGSRSLPIFAVLPLLLALGAYFGSAVGLACALAACEGVLLLRWVRLLKQAKRR